MKLSHDLNRAWPLLVALKEGLTIEERIQEEDWADVQLYDFFLLDMILHFPENYRIKQLDTPNLTTELGTPSANT